MKNMWRPPFSCAGCGEPYPEDEFPYLCPACGGIYDHPGPWSYQPPEAGNPGLSKYTRSLPFPPGFDPQPYSLGEGGTPLIEQRFLERTIHLKCEFQNPTGSFKDRGTFVLVASLAPAVREAVEDSSGNAGASFAAYARRGGIKATIFVPAYASGPKRDQIAAYNANLIPVEGPRIEASKAAQRRAEAGVVYASHAHQPHVLSGMGTLAYELYESLGRAPGAVVLPLGQGTLLLGIERGFRTLMQDGSIDRIPKLIGVQASVCSPFQDLFERGEIGAAEAYTGHTVAEGVRIARPLRAEAVAQAIRKSGGTVLAVEEEQIQEGRDAFASRGFYLEPTAAIVWGALLQGLEGWPDPVVAILTGSGLKTGR